MAAALKGAFENVIYYPCIDALSGVCYRDCDTVFAQGRIEPFRATSDPGRSRQTPRSTPWLGDGCCRIPTSSYVPSPPWACGSTAQFRCCLRRLEPLAFPSSYVRAALANRACIATSCTASSCAALAIPHWPMIWCKRRSWRHCILQDIKAMGRATPRLSAVARPTACG